MLFVDDDFFCEMFSFFLYLRFVYLVKCHTYYKCKEVPAAYWLFCIEKAGLKGVSVHDVKNTEETDNQWVFEKNRFTKLAKSLKESIKRFGEAKFEYLEVALSTMMTRNALTSANRRFDTLVNEMEFQKKWSGGDENRAGIDDFWEIYDNH